MLYSILYERVNDPSLPEGYYYAHIPVLDLTTHGKGIDGAKAAALDLLQLWIDEKRANGEVISCRSVQAESGTDKPNVGSAALDPIYPATHH